MGLPVTLMFDPMPLYLEVHLAHFKCIRESLILNASTFLFYAIILLCLMLFSSQTKSFCSPLNHYINKLLKSWTRGHVNVTVARVADCVFHPIVNPLRFSMQAGANLEP